MATNSYTSSQISVALLSLLSPIGLCLLSIVLFIGCGDGESADDEGGVMSAQVPLSIIGEYIDPYGSIHEISSDTWTQTFIMEGMEGMEGMEMKNLFQIEQYSTQELYIIAQNSSENEYSPSLWSRFDWLIVEGELWYCQTRFDATSSDEALSSPPADPSDITRTGCGTFPWTMLIDH
jgi:hypothetical protein